MAERTMQDESPDAVMNSGQADAAEQARVSVPPGKSWVGMVAGAGALLLFLLIYLLRLDAVVGQMSDDAWYVLLAKALATGQGYTLINSPSPGILPLYPPAFPWLLSLVFRVAPDFPQNVWLLKSVSILAMLGAGIAVYYYFRRLRAQSAGLAFGIALATVFNASLVFLATSAVMSECVFTLVQLLAIVAIERAVELRKGRGAWIALLLGAGLVAAAFLTRSFAIALVVAALVYVLKARLPRAAVIFAASVALLIGPWMLYTRLHAPTAEQRAEQGNPYVVISYTRQFWHRMAGNEGAGTITLAELPERVWHNTVYLFGRDVARIVVGPLYDALTTEMMKRRVRSLGTDEELGMAALLSFFLGALAVIGFVSSVRTRLTFVELVVPSSLGLIMLWPWEPFRFVLPLVPFLIFYLVIGIGVVYRLAARARGLLRVSIPPSAVTAMVGLIIAVNVYGHLRYILRSFEASPLDRPPWTRSFGEMETMFRWISERVPKEEVIATNAPAQIYLYTGHRTISSGDPAGNWERWDRLKVRYLVFASIFPLPVDPAESRYKIVYRPPSELTLRVVDLGPPGARTPWGAPPAASPLRATASR